MTPSVIRCTSTYTVVAVIQFYQLSLLVSRKNNYYFRVHLCYCIFFNIDKNKNKSRLNSDPIVLTLTEGFEGLACIFQKALDK
jgi:hypothetical protein